MADDNGGTTYKGIVLTGPENFHQWKQAVLNQSEADGTASLFCSDDLEAIIPEPEVPERHTMSPTSRAFYDLLGTVAEEEKRFQDVLLADMDIYQIKRQEFEDQQKRLEQARLMLTESIDVKIQHLFIDMSAPMIWDSCLSNFKVKRSMALFFLRTQLRKLKLVYCDNVQEYLSQMRNITMALKSEGDHVSDAAIKRAIFAGLTPKYDRFIDDVQTDARMGYVLSPGQVEKRLLHLERLIAEREKLKEPASGASSQSDPSDTSGEYEKNFSNGGGKHRVPCPYCKKWHPGGEDNCWFKHPEKNPHSSSKRRGEERYTSCYVDASWDLDNDATSWGRDNDAWRSP